MIIGRETEAALKALVEDCHDIDPPDLAEAIASTQEAIRFLRTVEQDLATELGRQVGKSQGDLEDGRHYTLQRSSDRKEWAHDDWQRDVRRAIVQEFAAEGLVVMDPETGEVIHDNVRALLQGALAEAQAIHGAQAPKSTALKALGLYASDYCTSSPSGWRFTVPPTTTKPEEK